MKQLVHGRKVNPIIRHLILSSALSLARFGLRLYCRVEPNDAENRVLLLLKNPRAIARSNAKSQQIAKIKGKRVSCRCNVIRSGSSCSWDLIPLRSSYATYRLARIQAEKHTYQLARPGIVLQSRLQSVL